MSSPSSSVTDAEYPVWDRYVRIVHWYLPLAVTVMWWSGEQGRMDIHQWVGSSLLCVVAVRMIWGFIGSEPARFTHFLAPPLVVWRYLRRGGEYAGHNPLGGWSVMAMLSVLLVQSASGLFSRDDLLFEGPFSYWASDISGAVTEWHLINWQVLQVLIALHLLAVAWYQWRKRQPLIQAMWSGKAGYKVSTKPPRPLWLAFLLLMMAAVGLWGLITIAPQAPSYY